MGKDYYKLLGVDKGAGEAELKKGTQQARPSLLISCVV
jgi:DnaJ-class molecular chaperone